MYYLESEVLQLPLRILLNEARGFRPSEDYPMRFYCAQIILYSYLLLQG